MELKQFEIVKSLKGRDIGNVYLISTIIDDNYVLVIDGKTKPISKPKRKKEKHLVSTSIIAEELSSSFENRAVNDAKIRKILKDFKEKQETLNI